MNPRALKIDSKQDCFGSLTLISLQGSKIDASCFNHNSVNTKKNSICIVNSGNISITWKWGHIMDLCCYSWIYTVVHLLTLHINFHFQEGRQQKRQCAKIRKGTVSSWLWRIEQKKKNSMVPINREKAAVGGRGNESIKRLVWLPSSTHPPTHPNSLLRLTSPSVLFLVEASVESELHLRQQILT